MPKAVLAAVLGISMHFSLCTGGVLSVASAAAEYFAMNATPIEQGPMSYGAIGYLSCARSKPSESVSTSTDGGCDDADACLAREHTRSKDTVILSLFFTVPAIPPTEGVVWQREDFSEPILAYLPPGGLVFPERLSIVKNE